MHCAGDPATTPATADASCTREAGVTINGGDIVAGFYNTATAEQCCQACNLRGDCQAWSYGGGVCWRKGAGGTKSGSRGAVSGSRCSRCGTLDESLPACQNATAGTPCFAAIAEAMNLAKSPQSSWCAVRGYGLLATDPAHVFQSYVHENSPGAVCTPPCLPDAATAEVLTLRPIATDAIPGRFLGIGVPSACREGSNLPYLAQRLAHHARSALGDSVRLTAWQSHNAGDNVAERGVLEGLGFAVGSNVKGYPPFRMRRTLGDPAARVRWRSNEALDYSRLLNLTYAEGTKYILIVQDDTFAAPDLGRHVQETIAEVERRDPEFGMVSLYTDTHRPRKVQNAVFEQERGPTNPLMYGRAGQAVALLYRREVVPALCEFISQNYMEAPLDWLIYSYVGHLDNDGAGRSVYGTVPNLFQHVGWASTARFKNKVQGVRKFTSSTFSWLSLQDVEAAIRDKKM